MSFSRTWWGQRFLSELERFTDPARLARGRTYARNGKILSYTLKGTTITAQVRGTVNPYFGVYSEPIYTTMVTMTPIPKAQWQAAIATLSKRAGLVTRLLVNEMPDTIDDLFAESGLHLLPHDHREFVTRCSCPDWANPCKHVAGVYSLLAANLDRDPFLLFELRGLSRRELRRRLEESTLGRVLAESLVEHEAPVESEASFHTTPVRAPMAAGMSTREFWTGAKPLPPAGPFAPPPVPGLLIKRGGDFPAFWHRDNSFIEVMEGMYERVRNKSAELK